MLAPVLTSRAHYAVSDVDHELEHARTRLERSLAWASAHGITARGRVGDPSARTAIEDELRDFGADEIIVVTHRRRPELAGTRRGRAPAPRARRARHAGQRRSRQITRLTQATARPNTLRLTAGAPMGHPDVAATSAATNRAGAAEADDQSGPPSQSGQADARSCSLCELGDSPSGMSPACIAPRVRDRRLTTWFGAGDWQRRGVRPVICARDRCGSGVRLRL